MKKVFDQTVRDLKRGVNKKVLKVPGIEQKVLDATSNEPWGPHGSLLADIAHASKNYHEYQMIMIVIWKRINDTGKNWRHVYKGLTVLEYLVAHGSERVIEEIKEHAYQISTLSDFQYIDSGGRDQGSNVRKKSQSLVLLVNDKERILEVRQKAAANRDKFRNTSSTGGMYRPGSYSSSGGYGDRYDDDRYEGRYGSRDDDRNSYGREREGGYKDDDRYGRYGDNSSRDGERNGRDSEDHYGRDSYRDDNYRGRSRSVDDYNNNSRSRSSDRDQDRAFDDDGNSSSRGSGARADEHSQEGRRLDRKFSEQNLGDPPSYEDVVSDRSPVHNERVRETSAASAPKTSSPPASTSPSRATTGHVTLASPANQGVDTFDEFDPRGAVSAPPTTSNSAEVDFLGSLSESYSSNALAIMPAIPATAISEADAHGSSGFAVNQAFEDPFGDTPFKATPSAGDISGQPPSFALTTSFHPSMNQSSAQPQPFASKVDGVSNFDFGDTFPGISYTSSTASNGPPPSTNPQFMSQELSIPNHDIDILADILPPSGPLPPTASQDFPASVGQPTQPSTNTHDTFLQQSGATAQTPSGPAAQYNSGFFPQSGFTGPVGSNMPPPSPSESIAQHNGASFLQQSGSFAPVAPQAVGPSAPNNAGNFHSHHRAFQSPTGPAASHHGAFQSPTGPAAHHGAFQSPTGPAASYHGAFQSPTGPAVTQNNDVLGNFLPQVQPTNSMSSQSSSPASMGQLAIVPQPSKEKFEPKSTVWADTLSRGLVNFNISGSKTNPLADIGIDFEAINRKEKRMEKPTAAPVASNITMGKAMGSGSGIGRAGAGAIRPPTTPMMGSGMGMGMGMGGAPRPGMGMGMGMGGAPSSGMGMGMGMGGGAPGAGMGMGGYGGMNQPMGMGMGMNMGMGMGQGAQMQQQPGLPPGSTMSGGYNPMMGAGGYAPQPYGGGYR